MNYHGGISSNSNEEHGYLQLSFHDSMVMLNVLIYLQQYAGHAL
jgi:hypothetical protein